MSDATERTSSDAGVEKSGSTLLEVDGLHVSFRARRRRQPSVRAVNGVDLTIGQSETLGLVGESGSGKSTVGRAIMRLVEPDAGAIRLLGHDLARLSRSELRSARHEMQMVFQDPYSSMNPAMVVADIIGEPLEVQTKLSRTERNERVASLLDRVGLSSHHLDRYPYEFSGGQRQRIAIARAIANSPSLVVCDEAVSALDVSTQNQIINLLEDLQDDLGISYLFIAHDLAVVRHIARRTAVMYLGRIVEEGPSDRVFEHPAHPYSLGLLAAVPIPDPRRHTRPRTNCSARRTARPLTPSARMPVQHSLPLGYGDLRARNAEPYARRRRRVGRLPPPDDRTDARRRNRRATRDRSVLLDVSRQLADT